MEKIDWNYWLKLNKLSNEEMIFLTLGLNPVNIDIDNFMGERYILDKENLLGKSNLEYDKRMRFLKESRFRPFTFFENLSDGGWSNYFSADGNGTQVIKKRFLLWLKKEDMQWELPPELQAYIEKLDKPKEEKPTKPSKPNDNLKEWKAKAKEVGEKYLDEYGLKGSGVDKTLKEICNYVAKELDNLGYTNLRGSLLIGDTIRSECLGGEWYQAMIAKGKVLSK